ncbi:MAG TPA: hypothetical protein VG347_13865 [Verrucomicrobiae bacterium]|nr:hypothetical protein [Verrucomicrobiae bacterium]
MVENERSEFVAIAATAAYPCEAQPRSREDAGAILAPIKKKGRPGWDGLLNSRQLLLLGGFLRLDDGVFTLDVGLATFFVFGFIVLLSHKSLYIICWLRFCV